MTTFQEANLARNALKIPLSHHAWSKGSAVMFDNDGFYIVVYVSHIDNNVRKLVPSVYDGVSVKIELAH